MFRFIFWPAQSWTKTQWLVVTRQSVVFVGTKLKCSRVTFSHGPLGTGQFCYTVDPETIPMQTPHCEPLPAHTSQEESPNCSLLSPKYVLLIPVLYQKQQKYHKNKNGISSKSSRINSSSSSLTSHLLWAFSEPGIFLNDFCDISYFIFTHYGASFHQELPSTFICVDLNSVHSEVSSWIASSMKPPLTHLSSECTCFLAI